MTAPIFSKFSLLLPLVRVRRLVFAFVGLFFGVLLAIGNLYT